MNYLVFHKELGEGRQADEEVQDDARVRVEGSVVERAQVGTLGRRSIRSAFKVFLQVVVVVDVMMVTGLVLNN